MDRSWIPWRPIDLRDDVDPSVRDDELLRTVGLRLGATFDRTALPMALVAADGAFLRVNRSLVDLLGQMPTELNGGTIQSALDPQDVGPLLSRMRLAESGGGRAFGMDARIRAADGSTTAVFLTGLLVSDDEDRPLCFVVQIHDFQARRTAREELERTLDELRRADEQKSRFVAVAAHELRSPLTSVLGFAKTLSRHWEVIAEDERRQHLGLVVEQAERLSRLVGDLLTISRIEGGSVRMQKQTLDALQEVGSIVAELPCAEDVDVVGDEGLKLEADPDHLRQMLTNLVTNAYKYGETPIEVEIRDEGDSIEILVRDEGPGVPREFVPQLFESFSRAETANTRGSGGTGLGLSIVKGLAKAHGGDAWYEPNHPTGACFGIRLPVSA